MLELKPQVHELIKKLMSEANNSGLEKWIADEARVPT